MTRKHATMTDGEGICLAFQSEHGGFDCSEASIDRISGALICHDGTLEGLGEGVADAAIYPTAEIFAGARLLALGRVAEGYAGGRDAHAIDAAAKSVAESVRRNCIELGGAGASMIDFAGHPFAASQWIGKNFRTSISEVDARRLIQDLTLVDIARLDRSRPLIEGLDLDVKPGQRIAIVGPTGCGKTTLINLLMRFYDVNGGSIKVSGTDIRDVTRASLRGSYGMVLQDTWLRAGTVRENIAYGKPDASLEEIVAAAKAAHADSFIRRLPEGYNTVIAEDGGNISQGQKQLLCIARVMLCLPPMLILDEATSSIDTRTEVRIQKAFARMMQGRTSFIVAHRLSTIKNADQILVMKAGNIIEHGTHEELLARGGFYANLYASQFAKA